MTTLTRILNNNKVFEDKAQVSAKDGKGEANRYRDLDTRPKNDTNLRAYDLFSLFTANIIVQDVKFVR